MNETLDKIVETAGEGGFDWLKGLGIVSGILGLFVAIREGYSFYKETLRDILPDGLNSWIGGIIDMFMGLLDSEKVASRQGITERLETSEAYTAIEKRYKIPGLGDKLKQLVLDHFVKTVDYKVASIDLVENSKELYNKVKGLMEVELRNNPDFKASTEQIAQLKLDAEDIAFLITGLPKNIDPAFIAPQHFTSGYGALLRETQIGIAREGEYTKEEVPGITFNLDALREQARAAAAPAASMTSGGESTGDQAPPVGLPPVPPQSHNAQPSPGRTVG